MLARLRGHLTYANAMSTIAVFVAVSTGGAYAINEWTGANIVDESLTGADVRGKAGTMTTPSVNGSLTTHDIAGQPADMANGAPFVQGSLTTWDIADESLTGADVRGKSGTMTTPSVNGSLTTHDISGQPADMANGTPFVQGSLSTWDVADGTLRSADVLDNSLTGADIKDQAGVDTCVSGTRVGQLCVRVENFARPWDEAFNHCANLDLRLPTLGEALELVKTHDIANVNEDESFWTSDTDFMDPSTLVAWVVDDSAAYVAQPLEPDNTFETVCVTTPTN